MDYKEFCEEISLAIQSITGSDYKVSVMKVNKLNGITLQSLVIQKDGETAIPNIYLDEYYEKYKNGISVKLLAAEVMNYYFQAGKHSNMSIPSIMDFDAIKDKIFFKLINYDKNKELLGSMPYIKWLDLAVVFSMLVKQDTEGIGSFYITISLQRVGKWILILSICMQ